MAEKSELDWTRPELSRVGLGLALLVGAVLRLWLLRDQVLLNDEWHGLHFVLDATLREVASYAGYGATSIPMNLYTWALLHTTGWSELLLRLPSLVPGMLAVAVFPLLLGQTVGARTRVLFAFLLAVSPLLVLYSRLARPYAAMGFFGFVAFLELHAWLGGAPHRRAVRGALAAWAALALHLASATAVFAPLACAGLAWLPSARLRALVRRRPQAIAGLALAIAVAALAVYLPHLRAYGGLPSALGQRAMGAATLAGTASLVSGSGAPWLVVAVLALAVLGWLRLLRAQALLALTALLGGAVHLGGLAWSQGQAIDAPHVVARYCAALLPLYLLCVACGLDAAAMWVGGLARSRRLGVAFAAGFLVLLFACGPLPASYRPPNAFTHHGVHVESFAPVSAERPFTSRLFPPETFRRGVPLPAFYASLAQEPGNAPLVEFPMPISDSFSWLYFYQRNHRRPVRIGYSRRFPPGARDGRAFLNVRAFPGQVLARVPDPTRLRLASMVDLDDPHALIATGARYLIVHRNVLAEALAPAHARAASPHPALPGVLARYRALWGPPVHEDAMLVVFEIPAAG